MKASITVAVTDDEHEFLVTARWENSRAGCNHAIRAVINRSIVNQYGPPVIGRLLDRMNSVHGGSCGWRVPIPAYMYEELCLTMAPDISTAMLVDELHADVATIEQVLPASYVRLRGHLQEWDEDALRRAFGRDFEPPTG